MRQYTKYPKFTGLQEYVWEYLNRPGYTIPSIRNDGKSYSKNDELEPVWHTKSDLDKYVAGQLGLRLEDYGIDKGRNPLYKEIAGEIRRLRLNNILVDWKKTESGRGMGIWRLADAINDEYPLLEKYVIKQVKKEIEQGNFHSMGSIRTIYTRTKQTIFKSILEKQYHKCILCGFKIPEYMIGAHIVPYYVMREEDPDNSMNPTNGLLLCRFCDVAFEKGSIIIESNYKIEISKYLKRQDSSLVKSWLEPIPEELMIKNNAKYPPDPKYLKRKKRLLSTLNHSSTNFSNSL